MDSKTQPGPAADRVYEDYEPPSDWARDEASDTLILMIPGFRKEQLRVQVTSNRVLKLSGERQVSENKWRRFREDVPLPRDSDSNGISAKFETGILYVRLPKQITPITKPPQEAAAPPPPPPPKPITPPTAHQQKPKTEAEPTQKGEKTTPPREELEPKRKNNELVASQIKDEKGKAEKREHDDIDAKEKRAEEASTSKAHQELITQHETPHDGLGYKGAEGAKVVEKMSPTMHLLSRQTQDYKNALSGLVEELKNKKKLANMLFVIFLLLVFWLYVKSAIKSSFEGSRSQYPDL